MICRVSQSPDKMVPFYPFKKLPLALPCPPASVLAAPFLFSPETMEGMTSAEARGEFTAERFKERHPDKYKAVVYLLGKNYSHREIARVMAVHHRTVARVLEDEAESIDALRKRLAKKARLAADLQLDRLLENPGVLPPASIGLTVSQLITNAEQLEGRATVITEHHERIDLYSNYEVFIRQHLPPGPGIGLAGEIIPAIEAPSQSLPADSKSEGPAPAAQVREHDVTAFAPDIDPEEGARHEAHDPNVQTPTGAGGGSPMRKGAIPSMRSDPENFSANEPTSEAA